MVPPLSAFVIMCKDHKRPSLSPHSPPIGCGVYFINSEACLQVSFSPSLSPHLSFSLSYLTKKQIEREKKRKEEMVASRSGFVVLVSSPNNNAGSGKKKNYWVETEIEK